MRGVIDWIVANKGVLARILMRYLGTVLAGGGYISDRMGAELAADPDLMILVGVAIAAAAEGGWLLAKRLGWAT